MVQAGGNTGPEPGSSRHDRMVLWSGGLLLLLMIAGGAAGYWVFTQPMRSARVPQDGPAPRGEQIRDMPIDQLLALEQPRHGNEAATTHGDTRQGEPGRGGVSPAVPASSASPDRGRVPPDGWFDGLVSSIQAGPAGGDGEPGRPPRPSDAGTSGEAPCALDFGEFPGSAVQAVGRIHLDAVDLDADVVVHLLYTLQQTRGLAFAPGSAPAVRSYLVRLRKDLLILANLEVAFTALLDDRDKETLLEAMVEEAVPPSPEDLEKHLAMLAARVEAEGAASTCEPPPVVDDVYLERPWRFGFPITALVVGLPGILERGRYDPNTLCRLAALLSQASAAATDARQALEALPGAVEQYGLTLDRILRLPTDEKKRFESPHPWIPVLLGMLDATIETL